MKNRVWDYQSVYDVLATLVPGGVLLSLAVALAPHVPQAQRSWRYFQTLPIGIQLGIGIVGLLVVGHGLHPLGNFLEWLTRAIQGRPMGEGHRLLCTGGGLSAELTAWLDVQVPARLGIPCDSDDAFDLCYAYVRHRGRDKLPARLRALEGFYRQLVVVSALGAGASAAVFAWKAAPQPVLILAIGLVLLSAGFFYRYLRFSRLFAKYVVRAFVVLVASGTHGSSLRSQQMSASSSPAAQKKKLAIDLDGVLASFDGWKGEGHIGPPLDGLRAFLDEMQDMGWEFVIYTARRSRGEVARWLVAHGLAEYFGGKQGPHGTAAIAGYKPHADVYLDDRAMRFDGSFDGLAKRVGDFTPYWKRSDA